MENLANKNLAKELAKIIKTEKSIQIDKFFDRMNIPLSARSNYIVSILIMQAEKILAKDNIRIGMK